MLRGRLVARNAPDRAGGDSLHLHFFCFCNTIGYPRIRGSSDIDTSNIIRNWHWFHDRLLLSERGAVIELDDHPRAEMLGEVM